VPSGNTTDFALLRGIRHAINPMISATQTAIPATHSGVLSFTIPIY
jgi:hypothetical protein